LFLRETRERLVQEILTSCEKALSTLNPSRSFVGELHPVGGVSVEILDRRLHAAEVLGVKTLTGGSWLWFKVVFVYKNVFAV
jgi:hypothetical protein